MALLGIILLYLTANWETVDRIFIRQAEISQRLKGVNYHSDLTYTELDLLKKRSRTINCRRRVIMNSYEHQQNIWLGVSLDGREVTDDESRILQQELEKKGLVARRSRLPFLIETRNEYDYEVTGKEELNGETTWVVKFFPRTANSRYLRGKGYVLTKSYDVVRLEFQPAIMPFVVRNALMVLEYSPVEGFWLPSRFWLEMEIGLKVIKDLFHWQIKVEDIYTDYRLKLN